VPLLLWQPLRPEISYNNAAFEQFYNVYERSYYQADWKHVLQVSKEKLNRLRLTYFWAGVLLILPSVPFTLRDRRVKLFWIILAMVIAALFTVVWSQSHYAAPLTCILYGLLVQGVRHLRTMTISRLHIGVAFSRVAILLLMLDVGTNICYHVCDPLAFACGKNFRRATLLEKLQHLEGKHLVIVRYAKLHHYDDEWVYNGAEIDSAKVLWTRELDPQQNAKLLTYFKDRRIWLAQPDIDSPLTAYPASPAAPH
jgi:hypothetical protein